MADDTMEISSEHGHHVGDDDIDIDIDFTAGRIDEDYVLEDAASSVGFGDDFHPQPFTTIGHDDLMVDEEEESFPMPMDGEDFMQDEDSHNMEHEPLDVSFTPADVPALLVDEHGPENVTHVTAENKPKQSEVNWEANEKEPQQERNETNVQLEDPGEEHQENYEAQGHIEGPEEQHHDEGYQEHEEVGDGGAIKNTEAPAARISHENHHSNSPRNTSQTGSAITGEKPRSPPTLISAPIAGPTDHGSETPDEASGTPAISQGVINDINPAPSQDTASASASSSPDVVVVYRDSEYSLFSKSETDDIDTYFLSDMSIKDKPLFDFFEAIRDVIRDDLTDEEELCLSVEALGLEVEEISSSLTGNVTIGQIISLHERLLRNDGIEFVPVCLTLGTRPTFLTRLAILTSGVSEGKGLSDILQWDDQSESFDESVHATDTEHGQELEVEIADVGENLESGLTQQEGSDATLPHEPASGPEPLEEVADTQGEDSSTTGTANGAPSFDDSAARPIQLENVIPLQKTRTAESVDHDEERDLIDYSDEDDKAQLEPRKDAKSRPPKLENDETRTYNGILIDFIPPCLKSNTCFCSDCNDLLLAEHEAINEELHRPSISCTAEDNFLEQAAEDNVEGEARDDETNLEMENGIEYDENDEEDLELNNLTGEHGGQSADFGEDGAFEFQNQEDEFFIEDGYANVDETLEGHESRLESIGVVGQEKFDEFDFGENGDSQENPQLTDQDAKYHDDEDDNDFENEQTAALIKETVLSGSSLGIAESAESESVASEKTLEAQPASTDNFQIEVNEENEDEIDYDDDDEVDALEVQESVESGFHTPVSGSGKRQRTDDEGSNTGSKEAKRPRS